jgi:Ser/Thr protein kinase RdoA (MazF antagonist)
MCWNTPGARALGRIAAVSSPALPLQHWPSLEGREAQRLAGGLINSTWQVGSPPIAVLQRLHHIFQPEVNLDIAAVTLHLQARGMPTPLVLPTGAGDLYFVDSQGSCWRALTWVDGRSHDTLTGTSMAAEAGALVARWHLATADLDHQFAYRRPAGHNTPLHMEKLRAAVENHRDHRLWQDVARLADEILAGWHSWAGSLDQPVRLAHGDLKISNLRFTEDGKGLCLLDLDTLAMLPLDAELGDAWRSWCNPSGEDVQGAHFELDLFQASARSYLDVCPLSIEERESLPGGVERICLELSSRFAADALSEDYFGWDPALATGHGEHSLLRAEGQLALSRSVRAQRLAMEKILLTDPAAP